MAISIRWVRVSPSANNFDLVLMNSEELDADAVTELLDRIQHEKHRGLSLSGRADKEFRRWCKNPETRLRSDAYVLLSNWFLTQSGDRLSMVATRCEELWDRLFPCRPVNRLSSPEPGRNHLMVPAEFELFWKMVQAAQGETDALRGTEAGIARTNAKEGQPATNSIARSSAATRSEAIDTATFRQPSERHLTIGEAKAALALTFGVSPDKVEITIRG